MKDMYAQRQMRWSTSRRQLAGVLRAETRGAQRHIRASRGVHRPHLKRASVGPDFIIVNLAFHFSYVQKNAINPITAPPFNPMSVSLLSHASFQPCFMLLHQPIPPQMLQPENEKNGCRCQTRHVSLRSAIKSRARPVVVCAKTGESKYDGVSPGMSECR
jgi:hypothetical protein